MSGALGLLAFRMLVGCHYWLQANQRPASLVSVMRDGAGAAGAGLAAGARVWPSAGPGLRSWFARCVVRELDQRFADAHQAYAAFLAMLQGRRSSHRRRPDRDCLSPLAPWPTRCRDLRRETRRRGTPLPLAVALVPELGRFAGVR